MNEITRQRIAAAKRLAQRRKAAGYATQKAFAEALGIKPNRISNWEYGIAAPNKTFLHDIALLLDCSVEDLGFPKES